MEIRAVCFDLDGTLYPNYRMYLYSLLFGVLHPKLLFHFSAIRKQIRHIRPIENFRRVQADILAERLGIPPEKALLVVDRSIYTEWGSSFRKIRTYPEVRETLSEIRGLGLKLGLLSDFPVETKLVYLGLDGIWDTAFCSETTGYLKPNAEPFLEAADRLGVQPSEVLYVGNSYQYDILGANRAGMLSAHLTPRPVKGGVADFSFRAFSELRDYVRSLVLAGAPDRSG